MLTEKSRLRRGLTLASAVSRRRYQSFTHRRQIAGIAQAIAVHRAAMFGCPHGLLKQGITSDSFDSRTSRIGSYMRLATPPFLSRKPGPPLCIEGIFY